MGHRLGNSGSPGGWVVWSPHSWSVLVIVDVKGPFPERLMKDFRTLPVKIKTKSRRGNKVMVEYDGKD